MAIENFKICKDILVMMGQSITKTSAVVKRPSSGQSNPKKCKFKRTKISEIQEDKNTKEIKRNRSKIPVRTGKIQKEKSTEKVPSPFTLNKDFPVPSKIPIPLKSGKNELNLFESEESLFKFPSDDNNSYSLIENESFIDLANSSDNENTVETKISSLYDLQLSKNKSFSLIENESLISFITSMESEENSEIGIFENPTLIVSQNNEKNGKIPSPIQISKNTSFSLIENESSISFTTSMESEENSEVFQNNGKKEKIPRKPSPIQAKTVRKSYNPFLHPGRETSPIRNLKIGKLNETTQVTSTQLIEETIVKSTVPQVTAPPPKENQIQSPDEETSPKTAPKEEIESSESKTTTSEDDHSLLKSLESLDFEVDTEATNTGNNYIDSGLRRLKSDESRLLVNYKYYKKKKRPPSIDDDDGIVPLLKEISTDETLQNRKKKRSSSVKFRESTSTFDRINEEGEDGKRKEDGEFGEESETDTDTLERLKKLENRTYTIDTSESFVSEELGEESEDKESYISDQQQSMDQVSKHDEETNITGGKLKSKSVVTTEEKEKLKSQSSGTMDKEISVSDQQGSMDQEPKLTERDIPGGKLKSKSVVTTEENLKNQSSGTIDKEISVSDQGSMDQEPKLTEVAIPGGKLKNKSLVITEEKGKLKNQSGGTMDKKISVSYQQGSMDQGPTVGEHDEKPKLTEIAIPGGKLKSTSVIITDEEKVKSQSSVASGTKSISVKMEMSEEILNGKSYSAIVDNGGTGTIPRLTPDKTTKKSFIVIPEEQYESSDYDDGTIPLPTPKKYKKIKRKTHTINSDYSIPDTRPVIVYKTTVMVGHGDVTLTLGNEDCDCCQCVTTIKIQQSKTEIKDNLTEETQTDEMARGDFALEVQKVDKAINNPSLEVTEDKINEKHEQDRPLPILTQKSEFCFHTSDASDTYFEEQMDQYCFDFRDVSDDDGQSSRLFDDIDRIPSLEEKGAKRKIEFCLHNYPPVITEPITDKYEDIDTIPSLETKRTDCCIHSYDNNYPRQRKNDFCIHHFDVCSFDSNSTTTTTSEQTLLTHDLENAENVSLQHSSDSIDNDVTTTYYRLTKKIDFCLHNYDTSSNDS